jgi:hypothetical protein
MGRLESPHVEHVYFSVSQTTTQNIVLLCSIAEERNFGDSSGVCLFTDESLASVDVPESDASCLVTRNTKTLMPIEFQNSVLMPFKETLHTFFTIESPHKQRTVVS